MKTKKPEPKKDKKVLLFNVAALIFSAVWGFNPSSEMGRIPERPGIASLYAAYVSLLTR
jgi:hypothetical protein